MHVEVSGQGPALVLIHGWAMHGGIFAPLKRALEPHFTVHLVDLPGHGRSPERDGGFDPLDCARRLLDVTPPAIWVGWSLGGLVAVHAALHAPDQVRALVPIASNPRFVHVEGWPHGVAHGVFASFADGLRQDWRRTLERFLALETLGSERATQELRELKSQLFERGEPALPVLEAGLRVLDETDLRERIAELQMPSLWIAGRRDRLVPAAAMRWAAERAGDGRYLELAGGHAPFLAQATEITDALRALVPAPKGGGVAG
jgi:pimeloyl-[acyl-carrier protein] methyl ester esterase